MPDAGARLPGREQQRCCNRDDAPACATELTHASHASAAPKLGLMDAAAAETAIGAVLGPAARAAVLPGKRDNVGCGTLLVVTTMREVALRRVMLPERRTGATLGDMHLCSDLPNAGTATRGAQKFPRAASPAERV